MNQTLKLSVLDQSPVHDDGTESSGLHRTVELAQACDAAGYHRYWLAEHHATPGYASPCPEIMIGQVAAKTERIRVGSGGVMLTHYSPFKVAETFRALNAFYPGRIDLGIGRAPGGKPILTQALAAPRQPIPPDYYPHQAQELVAYLTNNVPADHPFAEALVSPQDGGAPDFWMLGSSDGSAELCGHLGMGFALALFIGNHDRPTEIIARYRAAFRANATFERPQAMIAIAAICGDNREHAEWIASSYVFWKVQAFRHGVVDPLCAPDEALRRRDKLSPSDRAYYQETLDTMVLGDPEECAERLRRIAATYDVDEVMVVNVTHSFAPRKLSYQRLAAEFKLA